MVTIREAAKICYDKLGADTSAYEKAAVYTHVDSTRGYEEIIKQRAKTVEFCLRNNIIPVFECSDVCNDECCFDERKGLKKLINEAKGARAWDTLIVEDENSMAGDWFDSVVVKMTLRNVGVEVVERYGKADNARIEKIRKILGKGRA